MYNDWYTEEIFLTVKAYPTISKRYHEACCMAGITRSGKWIRLYPVYFRDLKDDQRFKKYSWISARVKKSTDPRQESHIIDSESIKILEEVPSTQWARRNSIILPHIRSAVEVFGKERNVNKNTLAIIKPREIVKFEIDETSDEDFKKQKKNLEELESQLGLFESKGKTRLELIPYSFRYEYIDDAGMLHRQKIVDWETYQLYRKCQHKGNWKELMHKKYGQELLKTDIHLFIGTMQRFLDKWIIIGVYCPPTSVLQQNMFDTQL
jgi:hypothetical protein